MSKRYTKDTFSESIDRRLSGFTLLFLPLDMDGFFLLVDIRQAKSHDFSDAKT